MMARSEGPGAQGAALRVAVCDDHALVRAALGRGIAEHRRMELVGEAADVEQALELVREAEPDVMIMDVEMPGRDGLAGTRAVLAEHPAAKVIILTAHSQPDLLELAFEAGATGYVLKSAPAEDVQRAIEAVARGETFVGGDFSPGGSFGAEQLIGLTAREREVLELLAEGLRVREIADRLRVRPTTVHTHVRNAIRKLEVDTRTEAVALAVRFSYLGAAGSR